MRTRLSLTLLTAAASFAIAAPAHAACGDGALSKSSAWQDPHIGLTLIDSDNEGGSIVGMWNVQFQGSGGFTDFGYQQWHSDGTEFMNSGGRPPAIQNYCLGVWQRSGPNRYRLNHWALNYEPDGTWAGRVNIREEVTVASNGQSFTGTFTIDVYDPQNNHVGPSPDVSGTVSGTRVTINTGI